MPERCTCGALLPPDSRFCHKCGKPQFEEKVLQEDDEPQSAVSFPTLGKAPEPVAPPLVPPIGFRNRLAVRTAFSVAAISFLISSLLAFAGVLALQLLATIVVSVAGGFFAVYLYSRRTAQPMTVAGGARIGWLTGIFSFLINMVIIAVSMVAVMGQGGFASFYEKQSSALGLPEEAISQIGDIAKNPTLLILVIGFALMFQFLTYAILTSLGGALGAKVLEKE